MRKQISVPSLVGATITAVKHASSKELDLVGLERGENCLVLELSNGVLVLALRDPEGNGPGCMVGLHGKDNFYLDLEA